MTKPPSAVYSISHPDIRNTIIHRIDRGTYNSQVRPQLFFRADDVGIPSLTFRQLLECFKRHKLPLCLATVPTWITTERLKEFCRCIEPASTQWCWHQHGWLHRNYEISGKKHEFGSARTTDEIRASVYKGRTRLEKILQSDFQPFFTPPWNRCSQATLETLVDLRFYAVSRSSNARPETPSSLPDFQVNVDLHTRKETSPEHGLTHLLTELEQGLASGKCGIMIHHQRMNRRALALLDLLLEILRSDHRIDIVHFGDMINAG